MSSPLSAALKSTIVRFILLSAGLVAASGCSTLPRQASHAEPCPPVRTLVCEPFGSETRCTCADSSRVDRQLDRLGPTALGLNAW